MTKQWQPLVDYERIDLALAGTWLGIREEGGVIGLGVGDLLVKAKLPPTLRFCALVEVDDPTPTVQMTPERIEAIMTIIWRMEKDGYESGSESETGQALAALRGIWDEARGERMTNNELREQLAAYAHGAWAGWMEYLFSKGEYGWANGPVEVNGKPERVWMMPSWAVERWQRQMCTAYADLPESEKESDRAEADKMLAIVHAGQPERQRSIPPEIAEILDDALVDYMYVCVALHDNDPDVEHNPARAERARAWLNEQTKEKQP